MKQAIWNGSRDVLSRAPGRVPLALRGPAEILARLLDGRVFDINVVLRNRPGLRVLDVGCGFGDLLLYLQSRGANVTGTDIDRRACEAAKRGGLDVHLGELSEMAFPEGSFDVVVLSHVLEHVPSPRELLAEVRRVLHRGGELHIAVPNSDSVGFRMEREFWGPLMIPEHLYFFDESHVRAYLSTAGFDVRQMSNGNIWRFRVSTWRAMRMEQGWRRSLAVTLSVCLSSLVNPARRDLIRLVAVAV